MQQSPTNAKKAKKQKTKKGTCARARSRVQMCTCILYTRATTLEYTCTRTTRVSKYSTIFSMCVAVVTPKNANATWTRALLAR